MGRPDTARPPQPGAARDQDVHPPAAPSRPTATAARWSRRRSGPTTVQVLRTYPTKRPFYPFARAGGTEHRRAPTSRRCHGPADWCTSKTSSSGRRPPRARWPRRSTEQPGLRVVIVVPRFPDRERTRARARPPASDASSRCASSTAAGGDRVLVYDLENEAGTGIYVHAKVCIVDDVWMMVGSDNMNRRSWTHDSELSCAVIDEVRDEREPLDPAGLGDGARRLARETRLQLWREHLGRTAATGDDDLVDPDAGLRRVRGRGTRARRRGTHAGRVGERPPGHAPGPPARARAVLERMVGTTRRPGRQRPRRAPVVVAARRSVLMPRLGRAAFDFWPPV